MRWIERDGVRLFYREALGEGQAVLLVHGWCCDHTYFAPQFDYFAGGGAVSSLWICEDMDRGDKPERRYTMQAFADDLAWLCAEIGLEKPVVIGYSMGGIVAFDLAARYPALPAAVVMLDAAVVLPSRARTAIAHFLEELRGPVYREVQREYVANVLFIPTDDQRRKERILEEMSGAPQHVMVSAMEGLRDYDPVAVAGELAVPALYIAADDLQPRADMARVHELCPQLLDGKTVGSGHFCQLEVPEQVNAMISRFLAIALPG